MGKPKSAEPPVKGPIKPIFSVLPAVGTNVGAAAAAGGAAAAADGGATVVGADAADDAAVAAVAAVGAGLWAAADVTQQAITVTKASWRNGASAEICRKAGVLRR